MAVVVVYVDDIVIFDYEGLDAHLIDVTEILKWLQEAGF
jgi:hypothetical protein